MMVLCPGMTRLSLRSRLEGSALLVLLLIPFLPLTWPGGAIQVCETHGDSCTCVEICIQESRARPKSLACHQMNNPSRKNQQEDSKNRPGIFVKLSCPNDEPHTKLLFVRDYLLCDWHFWTRSPLFPLIQKLVSLDPLFQKAGYTTDILHPPEFS